ncbi:hypothetical protein CMI41_03400 [Candidatus Pacearchaeota archaeon]|nr:hypothetical protein [Candidatus Pacearchaeota archaeon]
MACLNYSPRTEKSDRTCNLVPGYVVTDCHANCFCSRDEAEHSSCAVLHGEENRILAIGVSFKQL